MPSTLSGVQGVLVERVLLGDFFAGTGSEEWMDGFLEEPLILGRLGFQLSDAACRVSLEERGEGEDRFEDDCWMRVR